MMNQREKQALDRHITGNYGEDQFKDHSEETPDEQKPSEHLSFGIGFGFIVTANQNGTIPLDARVLARIENGGEEAIAEMQKRANAYPRLVEALRNTGFKFGALPDEARDLLRELGEL